MSEPKLKEGDRVTLNTNIPRWVTRVSGDDGEGVVTKIDGSSWPVKVKWNYGHAPPHPYSESELVPVRKKEDTMNKPNVEGVRVGSKGYYLFATDRQDAKPQTRIMTVTEITDQYIEAVYNTKRVYGNIPVRFKRDGTNVDRISGQASLPYDGTDFGSVLVIFEHPDDRSPEQVLADRLREILKEADEIDAKLGTFGYDVISTDLDGLPEDFRFTFSNIEIERVRTVIDKL